MFLRRRLRQRGDYLALANGIDEAAVARARAEVRTRILRAFAGCGLIERFEAREMLALKHSGFYVNAGVRIEAQDRSGLERLRQRGAELVYHYPKPQSGGKRADLVLTVLECWRRREFDPAADF